MASVLKRAGIFSSVVFLFQLVTLVVASAQVNVVPTFDPASPLPTQPSTLTLRLTNNSVQPATGTALTVNLPSGLFIADPADLLNTCSGTATHGNDPDNGTVALTGGTIPAGDGTNPGFCLVQVDVVAPVRGTYPTQIPVGALTATLNSQTVSNTTPAQVTLVAEASDLILTLSGISFGGETLQGHETTTRTITLRNNNNIPLTDVSLNWNFNQGSGDLRANNVRVVPGSPITSTCGTPTLDAVSVQNNNTPVGMLPTSILQMSGGTVPAAGTCEISFQIEPARDPGAPTVSPNLDQTHSVPAGVTSSAQGIGNSLRSNEVRLVIATGVQMTKRFNGSADSVTNIASAPGGTAEVWIRIMNSNAQNIENVSLTDVLPAGMTAVSNGAVFENGGSAAGLTCTGQFDYSDPSRIQLINATVPGAPPNVSGFRRPECLIRATVTFDECRSYINNIPAGSLTSSDPTQGYRFISVPNATLNVSCDTLTIQKSLNRDNLENTNLHAGDQVDAVFTLTNQSLTDPITNIRIPDDLRTMGHGFYVSPDRIVQNSCGAASNISGSTLNPYDRDFTLRVQELAPNQSCTITVRLITSLDAMTTNVNSATRTNTIPANAILYDISSVADLPYPFELSASRLLVRAIELEKSFSPTVVAPLGVSRLTITIRRRSSERNGTNNIALLDNLPVGHVVAPVPNVFNTCGGTLNADPGASAIQLTGGAIAAPTTINTSTAICQIQVNVQAPELPAGSTAETATNIIPGDPHGNPLGSGPRVYFSASDTRQPEPYNQLRNLMTATASLTRREISMSVNKSFVPENINGGAPSRVRIDFINTSANAIALTGVQLTDSFAGTGLRLYSTVAPTFTNNAGQPNAGGCTGGSFAGNPGDQQITLTNASIGVGAICRFEFNVTASQSGNHVNTIGIGDVRSNEGVTNSNMASATLGVSAQLGIGKGFNPPVIVAGGQSTLTLEIFNTNPTERTGDTPAIIDTLPVGVSIVDGTAATTCVGGTATSGIDGGAHFLRLDGGEFPADSVCLVTAQVTADATGTYLNQIPVNALNSVQGDTNADPADALLRVIQPPQISKAFNSARIRVGGVSTVTFTLTNPNDADVLPAGLTDASFSDELENMQIAEPLFLGGTCDGVQHNLTPGATNVTFSNISLLPLASCTVEMRVTSDEPGVWPNQSTGVSTEQTPEAGLPSNTVNLTVVAPLTLEKSFDPASIMAGEAARMTLIVRNPNTQGLLLGTTANPAIVDIFPTTPGNMLLAPVPDITSSCPVATQIRNLADAAPAPGDAGVRIYGGTIAANSSCEISFNVVVDAAGEYLNDIPEIRANLVGGASEVVTGPGDSALLDADQPEPSLSITKAVTSINDDADADSFSAVGDVIAYEIIVTNTGNVALSNVLVEDPRVGLNTTIPLLAVDTSEAIEVSYTVTQADLDEGQVVNVARAVGEGPDGAPTPEEEVEVTTPGPDADPALTVEKTLAWINEDPELLPPDVLDAYLEVYPNLFTAFSGLSNVIAYDITVTNTGNVTLSNVLVEDPLVGLSTTIPTLEAGASETFRVEYSQLTQEDIDRGFFENTARAEGTAPDGQLVSDEDEEVVPYEPTNPSISLVKTITDGGVYAAVGDVITYEIAITNDGDVIVFVNDVFDDQATTGPDYLSGWTDPFGTGLDLLIMLPGETWIYEATYEVTQADLDEGRFTNLAYVEAHGDSERTFAGSFPLRDEDTATAFGDQEPSLSILKTGAFIDANGDGVAQPGETITYTYALRNDGNVTLSAVRVAELEAEFSGTFDALDDPVFVRNEGVTPVSAEGSLAPGETAVWTASYVLTQADLDAGRVDNQAQASGTPPGDDADPVTDLSHPTDREEDAPTVVTFDPAPALSILKTGAFIDANGDGVAQPGETITYTYALRNDGNVTLSAVRVTELEAEFSGTFDALDDPVFVRNEGVIPVSAEGSLAPGETAVWTASYVLTQADVDAGRVDNQAQASGTPTGDDADPVTDLSHPTDREEDAPTEVLLPGSADLSLTKTLDTPADPLEADSVLTYRFTVQNTGNVSLSAVGVIDPLEGLSPLVFDVDASTAAAPGDALAPGDVAVWTAEYTLIQADIDAGAVVNTATASGTPPVGDPVTDEDTVVTPLTAAPDLVIVKSVTSINGDADAARFAAEGDVIAYAITITNTGNVTLSDVVVRDPLVGLETTLPTLTPGASEVFTVSYTVTQADLGAGAVVNAATASGTPPVGDPVTAEDDVVTEGAPDPALTLVKTVTSINGDADAARFAAEGDVIDYAITITNTGNVTLSDVVVRDPLVGLETTLPTLTPGASEVFTVSYTVTQADLDAGAVVNAATASGTPPVGDPVTAEDDVVTEGAPDPALTLVKTVTSINGDTGADSFSAVGDVIAYAITVTNSGNVTLSDVEVRDPLVGLETTLPTLAVGASETVTGSYTVTQADLDAGAVVNTATASGTPPVGDPVTGEDDVVTEGAPDPALTLVKTVTSINGDADAERFAAVGDVIAYAVRVTNTGNVTLRDVEVRDPLVGLETTLPTLAVGASETVTGSHTVTQADLDAGAVVNTATASGTSPVGDPVTDEDTVVTPVTAAPDLVIVKSVTSINGDADAERFAAEGDVIDYAITITNTGNVTLSDVEVRDPLVGLETILPTLTPGASEVFTVSYTVTQTDLDAGAVVNAATASGTPPVGDPVTAEDDVVTEGAPDPALTLVKTVTSINGDADAARFAAEGDVIDYAITITNTGNVTLSDVEVRDPLVGLETTLPTLAPGASEVFTVSYTVTQADLDAGAVVNTATASGTPPVGDPVTAEDDVVTEGAPDPALTLAKTVTSINGDADAERFSAVGDVIDYAITITNTGNVRLSNVQVEDPLVGLETTLPTLTPGASEVFTVSYTVTQADLDAGEVVNTATASGTPPVGDPVTAEDDVVTEGAPDPALTLAKTVTSINDDADAERFAAEGDVIAYAIRVTNTGNVTLSDVEVRDPLVGLETILPTLTPGASEVFTVSYTVTQADLDAGAVVNTATASGTPPVGDPVTAEDDAVTEGAPDPALTLVKTVTSINDDADAARFAAEGDVIDYAITITNTGNVTLRDVEVRDPLVGLETTLPTLTPGASEVFTVSYTVTQADLDAGEVVNTATASGTPPVGASVTAEDDVVTEGAPDPALTLAKTVTSINGDADAARFEAEGDVIAYAVTVTNTGNVTLRDVEVRDPLVGLETTLPTLAVGASETVTGSYTVTQADLDAGAVVNTATASGTPPVGDPVTAEDDVVTEGAPDPALTLAKTVTSINGDADAERFAAVGDVIDYAITITNTGNVTLRDVEVRDPLVGLETILPTLAPGASEVFTVSYTVTQADLDAGAVVNTATASATDPAGDPLVPVEAEVVTPGPDVAPAPGDLTLEKLVNRSSVVVGDVITYTLALENTDAGAARLVTLVDTLPAGFSYQPGTARIDGLAVEPVTSGRRLTWENVAAGPAATVRVTYDVYIGGATGPGVHVNRARGFDPLTGVPVTPEVEASVRIEADAVFQCSTVIGRVFDDLNHDGYFNGEPRENRFAVTDQDFIPGKGKFWSAPEPSAPRYERGLPGVRLVTPNGIAVTTDAHGRFSLPCAALPRDIGSNFMLKLDDRTLPLGYRMTTENPRVVRLTPGMLTKMNFGAAIFPVARVDLSARAFDAQGVMRPELRAGVQALVAQIAARPTVVRLSYQAAPDERDAIATARMRAVEQEIRRVWSGTGRYALTIERVVERPARRAVGQ